MPAPAQQSSSRGWEASTVPALLVVLIGGAALLGWLTGLDVLTSLGRMWIPMAPSTATLFLVFGGLLLYEIRRDRDRQPGPVPLGLALLGMAVALALLLLSAQGRYSPMEYLGLPIEGTMAGAPVGHMSPLTAAIFLVGGAALLMLLLPSPIRRRATRLGFALALALFAVAVALTLAYLLGGPLLYESGLVPPALTTSLAFLAFGSGLFLQMRSASGMERSETERPHEIPALLLLAGVAGTVGIPLVAYLSFRQYETDFRVQIEAQLTSVADLKVEELVRWRTERLGDGEVFADNPGVKELVARFLSDPGNAESRAAVENWLEQVYEAYDYDQLSLLDAEGTPRLRVPESGEPTRPLHADRIRPLLDSGRVAIIDFHRDRENEGIHLGVLAPIGELGVVRFRVDPDTYLYPLLRRWPGSSRTAETLLVREEGDEVVFLSPLRFEDDAALRLRRPVADSTLPAAMAVRGRKGLVEGLDYRDVAVVAAIRRVPDSPWYLVARRDRDEIYAPLRVRLRWTVGLATFLLAVTVVAVLVAWEQRSRALQEVLSHAEASRKQSEVRYRNLVEEAPIGIFTTSSRGVPLSVNTALARSLGFESPEEALHYYEDLKNELYVDPGRRDEFLRELEENGAVDRFEYEALTLGGEELWMEMSARIGERKADGSFTIEGFVSDVTDRKAAETALRRKEEILEGTQALAKVGGWEWNAEAERMHWTREVFRIHDLDPEEHDPTSAGLVDLSLACYPEGARETVLEAFQRCVAEGIPYDLELPFVTTAGREIWIRTVGRPVLEGDRVVKVVGHIMDVTEQKEARERERALQEQLLQAQKIESVGKLAGGVAHDFNNMLSVILGNTSIVMDEIEESSPYRSELEEIRQAAERSAELTRQLLAFARRQTIAPRVLDLNETIDGMLKMLRRLIGEDVGLTWEPASNLWPVYMDPAQIDQILANLVINARDALDPGGRVTIETENTVLDRVYCESHPGATPGPHVVLTVTDDGRGMTKEVLDQVFEPFFTTKPPGEGTGLGLSTVFGIVKQNGGSIHAYSEPGQGTSLKIYLPRAIGAEEAGGLDSEDQEIHGGDETLLLVEDEPAVLKLGRRVLADLGYTVLATDAPEKALEMARENGQEVALLLTDVIMPGMNGKDLADEIRKFLPELAVVYMSGYPARVIGEHGALEREVEFLQKPFSAWSLARKVRQVLDRA